MGHLRIVSMATLRRRLADALGDAPGLYHGLDEALMRDDPRLLDAAIEAVQAAPEATREAVHEVILGWLLSDDPDAFKEFGSPSSSVH